MEFVWSVCGLQRIFFAILFATAALICISTQRRWYVEKVSYVYQPKNSVKEESLAPWLLDNYNALVDISKDLQNYYLYFQSVASQTRYSGQKKNILDGYVAISSPLQKLLRLSKLGRKLQLQKMSKFIRKEITELQHERNCSEVLTLVSDISRKRCGFGCTLHSVVGFLIQAFVSNRTFILQSEGWGYAKEGWEYLFQPLGSCKSSYSNLTELPLLDDPFSKNETKRTARFMGTVEDWFHWKLPQELEEPLKKVHSEPYAWWISQFTAYVFRLQPWFEKELEALSALIQFSESVVGIQVRWGDKILLESNKHEVDEYMHFVEKWYRQLEHRGENVKRIVYVATEEPSVWVNLWRKYPRYKFIGGGRGASITSPLMRHEHDGLVSVVTDIYFLSRCRYMVCTLSSSVCRTAYELMLNKQTDASTRFQSIDMLYRFQTAQEKPMIATMDHEPAGPDELELNKGDKLLSLLDPHYPFNDGFLRGKNIRTNKTGKFPIFKVRENISIYSETIFQDGWENK